MTFLYLTTPNVEILINIQLKVKLLIPTYKSKEKHVNVSKSSEYCCNKKQKEYVILFW